MNMLKRGDERIFRLSTLALVAVIALMCMPTVAFGDVVTMKLGQPTTPAPNGVYVDPYPILVNGTTTLPLSCDDYAKDISVNFEWTANRYLLGALDTVAGTTPKFDAVNSLWGYTVREMYDAAAVLTVDLLLNPANEALDSYALWTIFDPGTNPPNSPLPHDLAASTLAAVSLNAPTYLYNHVYIYTAIRPDVSQEFIGYVPDGGMTLMLLGGALVGLETLRRRFRA
jgi:hypothetical protein